MTQAQLTTTQMGILSEEAYNDDDYFLHDGVRKEPAIITAYGNYTIIESQSTLSGMQALLLKAPDGNFVIAFRGTEVTKPNDILSDLLNGFINY